MTKTNTYIEIVRSTIPSLSSMSQPSCEAIFTVLAKHFTKVGITTVNDLSDLDALIMHQPDLVFLGMEFIPINPSLDLIDSNKLWLSDYFDQHSIAYTGSSQVAHEFGRNKPMAKRRILNAGLMSANYCVIKRGKSIVESDITLDYPLFIKPSNRGGGLGIDSESVVHNFKQLSSRAHYISTIIQSDSLIEEYLPGREFSVAILKDNYSKQYSVMPIELVAPTDQNGARLLSDEVKTSNAEQVLEVIDADVKSKITKLAEDSFHALGARDYGRIDIRLNAKDVPYFLEANLIPSLISGYGSFPKACKLNINLEYEPMIIKIAELGLTRNLNNKEELLKPSSISDLVVTLDAI